MKKALAILIASIILPLTVMADVSGEFQVVGGGVSKFNPVIRGNYVAWSELTDVDNKIYAKNLSTGDVWQLASGNKSTTYFQGKDYIDESGYVCWRANDMIYGMRLIENAQPVVLTKTSGDWLPENVTGEPIITEVCMDDNMVFFCAVTKQPFAAFFGVDINDPKPFFIKSFSNTKSTHKMSAENGYVAFDCKDGLNGDVYLYDIARNELTTIDDGQTDQAYPLIQKNFVFYLSSKTLEKTVFNCMAKDLSVMCFDISSNEKRMLYETTDGSIIPLQNPSSNYLVVRVTNKYNTSYIAIDPSSKKVTDITEPSYNSEFVFSGSASGDLVAVNYYRIPAKIGESGSVPGQDFNIRAFNIKTGETIQLCQEQHHQQYPMLSGNVAVWQDYRVSEGKSEIFGYRLP